MAEINQNYLYTDSNLWVEVKGNIARVGIDDYSKMNLEKLSMLICLNLNKSMPKMMRFVL